VRPARYARACRSAKTRGFSMSSTKAVLVALLALGSFTSYTSAQGTKGADVVIRLRLAGDSAALPPIRSCLVDKLSQMPDVKVATVPTDGVRFIVDIVAAKNAEENISGSLIVVETFPMEQFRPRIKEGEDADALLKNVRYYTLLRLHEPFQPDPMRPFVSASLLTLGIRCCRRNTPSVTTDPSAQPSLACSVGTSITVGL
jgi:hypothetical protein